MGKFQPSPIDRPQWSGDYDKTEPYNRQESKQVNGKNLPGPPSQRTEASKKDKGNDAELPDVSFLSRARVHYASLPLLPREVVVPYKEYSSQGSEHPFRYA